MILQVFLAQIFAAKKTKWKKQALGSLIQVTLTQKQISFVIMNLDFKRNNNITFET